MKKQKKKDEINPVFLNIYLGIKVGESEVEITLN